MFGTLKLVPSLQQQCSQLLVRLVECGLRMLLASRMQTKKVVCWCDLCAFSILKCLAIAGLGVACLQVQGRSLKIQFIFPPEALCLHLPQDKVEAEGMVYTEFLKAMKKQKRH